MIYSAPEDIAIRLKVYRLRRAWTLEQMADAVGCSTAALSLWENGERIPTELSMAKILLAFPDFLEIDVNAA